MLILRGLIDIYYIVLSVLNFKHKSVRQHTQNGWERSPNKFELSSLNTHMTNVVVTLEKSFLGFQFLRNWSIQQEVTKSRELQWQVTYSNNSNSSSWFGGPCLLIPVSSGGWGRTITSSKPISTTEWGPKQLVKILSQIKYQKFWGCDSEVRHPWVLSLILKKI